MDPTFKDCTFCQKKCKIKPLHDDVCNECLAALVIRDWLEADQIQNSKFKIIPINQSLI